MNDRSDIDRVLGYWFEDGPATMPDRVVDVVARRISQRPQRRPLRFLRRSHMSALVKWGAAAAAALIVAVVAWNLLPGNDGIGAPPSATPADLSPSPAVVAPSPTPTDPTQAPPCGPGDIRVSELRSVGGTARDTEIILILMSASPCTIGGYPTIRLNDSSGAELARATPDRSGVISLQADFYYHSQFKLESWCGPDSAMPLSLEYLLDGTGVPVDGWSIGAAGDLPGCRAGAGTRLSASKWTGSP